MDSRDLFGSLSTPSFKNPTDPDREIEMSKEDESLADDSIRKLDESSLDTKDLFDVFDDWQTKRTLTSKRVFVSTSVLVSSASWVGIDYTKLAFFGMKVADGAPIKFLLFIISVIVLSGAFYELSRRVDLSVRRAKIAHVDRDLKELIEPCNKIKEIMKRNNIGSIVDLYFDFRSAISNGSKHNAIDVFRAIEFYQEHLSRAGVGLRVVTMGEQAIIYLVAAYAVVALINSSAQLIA